MRGALGPKGKKTKGSQASAASTEVPPAGAPPVDTPFEPQEIHIPETVNVVDLLDSATVAITQMAEAVDITEEDYKIYIKLTHEIEIWTISNKNIYEVFRQKPRKC